MMYAFFSLKLPNNHLLVKIHPLVVPMSSYDRCYPYNSYIWSSNVLMISKSYSSPLLIPQLGHASSYDIGWWHNVCVKFKLKDPMPFYFIHSTETCLMHYGLGICPTHTNGVILKLVNDNTYSISYLVTI